MGSKSLHVMIVIRDLNAITRSKEKGMFNEHRTELLRQ